MRMLRTVLGLSSLLAIAGVMAPTTTSAAEGSYVACNRAGDCWRVHDVYAYGADEPITYYNSDWYAAHQRDEHIHWRSDPADDRGYYVEGRWHPDPGARREGRSGWRRSRRGHRLYRNAPDWVCARRGGWRSCGWRDWRCCRRGLDARPLDLLTHES